MQNSTPARGPHDKRTALETESLVIAATAGFNKLGHLCVGRLPVSISNCRAPAIEVQYHCSRCGEQCATTRGVSAPRSIWELRLEFRKRQRRRVQCSGPEMCLTAASASQSCSSAGLAARPVNSIFCAKGSMF